MPHEELSATELRDLRRLAGIMVPASAEFRLPGADDEAIIADIVRSLARDRDDVRKVLAALHANSGGAFADVDQATAEGLAMRLLDAGSVSVTALGRAVLQCYYRDDRVMRAIGREPRAPFPKGHEVEQGDWSLLDSVRRRPRMWRDVEESRR